jgi:hypothetical protein
MNGIFASCASDVSCQCSEAYGADKGQFDGRSMEVA